jgi:hypothetical protein
VGGPAYRDDRTVKQMDLVHDHQALLFVNLRGLRKSVSHLLNIFLLTHFCHCKDEEAATRHGFEEGNTECLSNVFEGPSSGSCVVEKRVRIVFGRDIFRTTY